MSPVGSARILGLDPGSLRTGFGIIDCENGNLALVAQGCIATSGGPSRIVCASSTHAWPS